VVLLTGSGAFAQLGGAQQLQDTFVGLNNAVDLMHGHQTGHAQQNLCIDNVQASDPVCDTYVEERFLGNFIQVGCADGDCAEVGLLQQLQAVGSQAQIVGPCVDAKSQAQTLDLTVGQGLSRAGGEGGGNANHVIVLQEDQYAQNSGGTMTESSNVVGLQNSSVGGSAGSTGAVTTTMTVSTIQSQAS
jgi:hypothetical protein